MPNYLCPCPSTTHSPSLRPCDASDVSFACRYHDMGLIGSYLGVMFCGGSGYYISPLTFIRNPVMWVELISKYGGTHMQAPNFAYGLVARKFIAKRPQPVLDLSSVRHMINAAEPIHVIDIEQFYAAFEMSGLPRGVVFPTYGLAEHTVFVCTNGKQVLTVDKKRLENDCEVVEVNSSTTPLERNKATIQVSAVLIAPCLLFTRAKCLGSLTDTLRPRCTRWWAAASLAT